MEHELDRRAARMGETRNARKKRSENVKEREHLEDLGVDGTLSIWIFRK
jgi:hypothetical protein